MWVDMIDRQHCIFEVNASIHRMRSGYSRIPVHEKGKPNSFIGMLLVKTVSVACRSCSLIVWFDDRWFQASAIRPQVRTPCWSLPFVITTRGLSFHWLFPGTRLLVRLFLFCRVPSIYCATDSQSGRAHLLLISRTPGRPGGGIGIITLEGPYLPCFLRLSIWSHNKRQISLRSEYIYPFHPWHSPHRRVFLGNYIWRNRRRNRSIRR